MTTIALEDADVLTPITLPMRGYLAGGHRQWREEVRGVLDPALADGAGTWRRWRALVYLQGPFRHRFERERRAVFALHQRLTPDQARHLWAGGELISQLLDNLHQCVGLCQRGEEFASMTHTVVNALEYWCEQVENALEGLPQDALNAG